MDGAVRQVIEQSNRDAFAGVIGFGSEMGSLMQVGVESYHVDYLVAATTYYMPDGETCILPMTVPAVAIPRIVDKPALLLAIRRAQNGEIKFPQFVAQSMASGCVGYVVWITGQHVGYLGRKGVALIDPFSGGG